MLLGVTLSLQRPHRPRQQTLWNHPLAGDTIVLQGRREHGFTVFSMRPIGKFNFVVDPNGNVVMIYDTGAQVCVMGSELEV